MRRAVLKQRPSDTVTARGAEAMVSTTPPIPPGRGTGEPPVRVLLVPGFVVDTYSEIEASFVELSARAPRGIEFLWLIPRIDAKASPFVSDARPNITEPVWAQKLREHGVPSVVGTIHKYNFFANAMLFYKLFRDHEIDVVYTHFGHERFWATLFGKLWDKRTIWNEHWHSLGTRLVTVKRLFYKLFVDEFVAVSRFIADSLPPQKTIHTLPNAIRVEPIVDSLDVRSIRKMSRRRELGIPDKSSTVVVLMVAAFRAWKRHDVALDVCRQVLRQCSNVHFIFLGEGPLRTPFLSRVDSAGIADRVQAPGYSHRVSMFYDATDICMLTSHNEPFGYCVLEAMKHARPMVAFDCGGPAEIIKSGETGLLVREGDTEGFARAIVRLVRDEEARRRIGSQARASVEIEYSRDGWINELARVLRGAAQNRERKLCS